MKHRFLQRSARSGDLRTPETRRPALPVRPYAMANHLGFLCDLHQRRSRIERRATSTGAMEFFNRLTSPEWLQTTEALQQPEHRERPYPLTVMAVANSAWCAACWKPCRCNVELNLRNLKTTTGMDVLSCETPQMNEKQLYSCGRSGRREDFAARVVASHQCLFGSITQRKVGHRPGRIAPRMRKRRSKPDPWLKVPRTPRPGKNERRAFGPFDAGWPAGARHLRFCMMIQATRPTTRTSRIGTQTLP